MISICRIIINVQGEAERKNEPKVTVKLIPSLMNDKEKGEKG